MRLLVTGATGLIGGAVVRAASSTHEVIVAGRRRPRDLSEDVAFVEVDLLNGDAAVAAIHAVQPTHLVHAAWETRQPDYWQDPINLSWMLTTTQMANAFADVKGTRFLQVGSCAEYDWTNGVLTAPRGELPATLYGKAKLAAFRAISAVGHDRFMAVEARIFWVYGPEENPTRFIPLVCQSYRDGLVPALGSGRLERDLIHVDDAAKGLMLLLEDRAPEGVVDVGTGRGTALADVAAMLAAIAGVAETGLGTQPDRPEDPLRLIANPASLRSTGWQPGLTVEEGLERTYAWWSERGMAAR